MCCQNWIQITILRIWSWNDWALGSKTRKETLQSLFRSLKTQSFEPVELYPRNCLKMVGHSVVTHSWSLFRYPMAEPFEMAGKSVVTLGKRLQSLWRYPGTEFSDLTVIIRDHIEMTCHSVSTLGKRLFAC